MVLYDIRGKSLFICSFPLFFFLAICLSMKPDCPIEFFRFWRWVNKFISLSPLFTINCQLDLKLDLIKQKYITGDVINFQQESHNFLLPFCDVTTEGDYPELLLQYGLGF